MAALGPQVVTATAFTYTAYGITFAVPFRCPGVPPGEPETVPDVVVRLGPVARGLSSPVVREDRWDAEPGRFLLRGGRRAGRFLVQEGAVTLDPNPGAEEDALARCFTGEVLPAVLRQRGMLVLHANAAVTPRGVVVIAGESGAGKSTTLAALIDRGCAMLADDVTALRLAPGGYVEVLPGAAQVHLTAAAVSRLGYEPVSGPAQPWRRMKSAIDAAGKMANSPGRLLAIYVLAVHAAPEVQVRSLTGVEKFNAFVSCVCGPVFARDRADSFPLARAVVRKAATYQIGRPVDRWTLPEVVETVLGRETSGP